MSLPYSHYAPANVNTKQANVSVGEALGALNPADSQLANYGIYGGAGALGGAGIGALINLLRGESALKGALIGGGIGGGLGLGAKALGDYSLSDSKGRIDALENKLVKTRKEHPYTTGDAFLARRPNPKDESEWFFGPNNLFQQVASRASDLFGGGADDEEHFVNHIKSEKDFSALEAIRRFYNI